MIHFNNLHKQKVKRYLSYFFNNHVKMTLVKLQILNFKIDPSSNMSTKESNKIKNIDF